MKTPGKPDSPSKLDDKALDAVVGGDAGDAEKKRKVPAKVTVPDLKIQISY